MDDFDRHERGSKSHESRKALMALVLGVVLIVVLAHWGLSRPATAGAGVPAAVTAAASPVVLDDDMSPKALAKLQVELKSDPTQPLLLQAPAITAPDTRLPRNPFRLAPSWQAKLTKPPEPQVAVDPRPQNPSRPVDPVPPRPEPQALRPADYKLQSLFVQAGQHSAIINSKEVRVGDLVGKAKVLEIRDSSVILQSADAPDGPKTELVMPGLIPQ